MKINQLSVFIENKAGRLANIAETLGDADVNIRAMSLSDTANFGIIRLIVDDTEKARRRLKDRGFTVRLTEVIAVEIPDKPGELGRLLRLLENANLNVEYIYGITDSSKADAVLILRCDNLERTIETLQSGGVPILDSNRISNV